RGQGVLVRHVVAVPGDHVQRRVVVVGGPEVAAELLHDRGGLAFFERGVRGQEVPLAGQAVGADRAAFWQREGGAEVLAQVAAGRLVRQLDAEPDAARDHGDLAGTDAQRAEL